MLGRAQERDRPRHSSAFQEWLRLLELQACFFPFVAQPKGPDVAVARVGACGAQEHVPATQLGAPLANSLQMRIQKCLVLRWSCLALQRQKRLGLGHCIFISSRVFIISSYRKHFKS